MGSRPCPCTQGCKSSRGLCWRGLTAQCDKRADPVSHSEVINGLAALLDNANTGDVQFVCLEHREQDGEVFGSADAIAACQTRKRILWAHSDILRSRSAYFRDLLAAGFTETLASPAGSSTRTGGSAAESHRRVHTITVDHCDFETLYWLLFYLYTGEIEFSSASEIRKHVSRATCNARHGRTALDNAAKVSDEWAWRRLSTAALSTTGGGSGADESDEVRTVRSTLSASSMAGSFMRDTAGAADPKRVRETGQRPIGQQAKGQTSGARTGPPSIPPRSGTTARTSASRAPSESRAVSHSSYPSYLHPAARSRPDPHAHPAARPNAASAFAIFCVAHRYRLAGLQRLAQAHLLDSLTPENACPLLLASYLYDDLHGMVQDFVIAHWRAVQAGVSSCRARMRAYLADKSTVWRLTA